MERWGLKLKLREYLGRGPFDAVHRIIGWKRPLKIKSNRQPNATKSSSLIFLNYF